MPEAAPSPGASAPEAAALSSSELIRVLEEKREQLRQELASTMRDVRVLQGDAGRAMFADEALTPANVDGDIELHLAQMRSESLRKVETALERAARGEHGICRDCGEPIAAARLRALPFALRCTSCEAQRETGRGRSLGSERHGLCQQCERPIGQARLRLMPGAVRCAACDVPPAPEPTRQLQPRRPEPAAKSRRR